MKQSHSWLHWSSDFYEHVFTPVPPDGRKKTSHVMIVTMGYTTALSCFVIGTKVGYALPFWPAAGACIAGNLILMFIGVFMGIIGSDYGLSTTFLVRQLFGKHASILVSCLIILLSIYWVGMNGDAFSRMIVTAFPRWPVPVAVTAVALVMIWGLTAAFGWRGLTLTSWLLTPLTICLAISGIWMIFTRSDAVHTIRHFVPSGKLTITAAIAAVCGNYIFGTIISPDLCRFSKSRKAIIQIILPSHTIGFILLNICGIIVAQTGNTDDFVTGTAKLGLVMTYLICSAMGLWTTENYNIYGGSLAMQNLFLSTPVEGNLSHRAASWILAGLAAALASLKALNYLMPIITFISILIPPIAGMMFAEYFIIRRNRKQPGLILRRQAWIPAWILGGVAGIWSYYAQFLISPIIALVVSAVSYRIFRGFGTSGQDNTL